MRVPDDTPPPPAPEPGQQPSYGEQLSSGERSSYGQQSAQPYPGHQPLPPYGYAPPRPTNATAIVALVLGILTGIGGIIAGHIALSQIKRTGEGGRGMALAGLIIGYVFTSFWVFYILLVLVIVIGVGATAGTVGLAT